MNREMDPFDFEKGVRETLNHLADMAPAAPDSGKILAAIRGRRTVRTGLAAAGGLIVILIAAALITLAPPRRIQPVAGGLAAPAGQPDTPAAEPMAMPTLNFIADFSFVPSSVPWPAAQGSFEASFPSFSMPAGVTAGGPGGLSMPPAPSLCMSRF